MTAEKFQQLLLDWFAVHGRKDLPWQQAITPYRVWLSEIMLQQTQVASVIPYFTRFTARFPTLKSLAMAELDDVLPFWAGLGYYARARNLHKTARQIQANGGKFPETIDELCELPGIGRSTAGAILSIAYQQSQAILDGNVKRVLARFHAVGGWTGDSKVSARLWELSQYYTPQENTAAYTQAIMDLGATLCTRSQPDCLSCPVASGCQAYATQQTRRFPEPKPRKALPVKHLYFLLLENANQQILLEKRPPTGIWGGLWSLPEFADMQELEEYCLNKNYQLDNQTYLAKQRHDFSHYRLDYTPVHGRLINPINNVMEANASLWYKIKQVDEIGLPAPIKLLLQQYDLEIKHDKNG